MSKVDLRQFDYKKIAEFDSAMWRAYYNHQFIKLTLHLARLLKTQLGLNWLKTIRIAYYAAWAATYYRINKDKGVDNKKVLSALTKFYKSMYINSINEFDYKKGAELELKWWDIHRSSKKNSKELEQALADSASLVYGVPPGQLTNYAHYRAEAMFLPQHQGDKQANPPDWSKIEKLLIKSWKELHTAVR